MKIPLSWLKDFVDIDLDLEALARTLTMAGLEVDAVHLVGLPMPAGDKHEFKFTGLSWEPDKIVVAQIDEVMPHPNADRLVLCRLQDGTQEHIVLTGAPDLFPYKGSGPLAQPIKVCYAKEGARIYDGHQDGFVLTTLKRAKIRGVESYSMVCSEKELGISDQHGGVIHLDPDAPTGMPLVDYLGDAVFEVSILPNMARNANIFGVARELAAITGKPLRQPAFPVPMDGPTIAGQVKIEITNPELNPRFVFGLVRGVKVQESPYRVQHRLRLAGMRPISSVVDATNYAMLEIGEPLHAFDYDVLVQRAGGKAPTIITRQAKPGERLTTLDDVDRPLDDFTEMVTDTAGALSISGVMGGAESEISDKTTNILLEGAAWNFINIRKTLASQKLSSEAGYRFSRGVHPAVAEIGVRSCLQRIAQWSGGQIAAGLVDEYPLKPVDPVVQISVADVKRGLGIDLSAQQIAALLARLEFKCQVEGDTVSAKTPPHRMDIGEDVIGKADLVEEVARIYGYDNIPATRLSDTLPPQRRNPRQEGEEKTRDLLADLGLQEVVSYRLTDPSRELRLYPPGSAPEAPYIRLQNPVAADRAHMRRSLLACVLETLERNSRLAERLAFFEIGPVFLPGTGDAAHRPDAPLPAEQLRLAIAMSGKRDLPTWEKSADTQNFNFFDLKGVIAGLLDGLHLGGVTWGPAEHPSFHPGKCARLSIGEAEIGFAGELHPLVKEHYDFGPAAVLAADLDLEALLALAPLRHEVRGVPAFPPVLEDIALVMDESVPAGRVEEVIRAAGGALLSDVRLFDTFRGGQIGAGKKSLAYSLTYQAPDRTLTDEEGAKIRQHIISQAEKELDAKLRG